ncbi:unnamed protein product [Rotaria socialis]|uniref:Uncharacterized protein n=1 Tax=Rotaria socialis TaxID=392032 RepID=A0A817WKE3_9BILA|nr:unnamed protein product [Rotaria socialis]
MNECHRVGIRNFKTIRYPGQIKLAFDLCTDDRSALRRVSSKGNGYNEKKQVFNKDKFKFDYFPIKKSTANRFQCSKILSNFIMTIAHVIFRTSCFILKYTIYLTWYLFKIFLSIIFRLLIESKLYSPKTVICHPIRCYHHQF